jgi:hypothetical protein
MTDDSGRIGKTDGEYNVCQFFENGWYEYTRRYVSADEAAQAFKHYTTNIASRVGIVVRVIITDGGDYVNAEWKFGEGLTYPTKDTPVEG